MYYPLYLNSEANSTLGLRALRLKIGKTVLSGVEAATFLLASSAVSSIMEGMPTGHRKETA